MSVTKLVSQCGREFQLSLISEESWGNLSKEKKEENFIRLG